MPAGSPLTQARRIAADSCPAGSPLTQAHRIGADSCPLAAAIPSPVDRVHTSRPGVPVCLSCCAHRNILNIHVGLVHGDSSGAGGSSCCGHGGHSSRLPLVVEVEAEAEGPVWAPDSSCPKEASAS